MVQVEAKNKREAQEIDRIFLMKQQREKEITDVEQQVEYTVVVVVVVVVVV